MNVKLEKDNDLILLYKQMTLINDYQFDELSRDLELKNLWEEE